VLVQNTLTKASLNDYDSLQADALEIAAAKAEVLIESYAQELDKRGRFHCNMLEETNENKACTSLARATPFVYEMKKLLAA